MTALSITALAKSFRAGKSGCSVTATVLRRVNLALWPGEIVALNGARGSGKSTLLRCAAGLLRPDSGSVFWFGGRVMPAGCLAYLSAEHSDHSRTRPSDHLVTNGALYEQLERAVANRCRIFLVDDLSDVGAIERRIVSAILQRRAAAGASILFVASEELARASFVTRTVTRTVTLESGALIQRRKRSAARTAASSCASRARTSARSTYGRSLRSPQ